MSRTAAGHYAGALRRELSARNQAYARRHQLPHVESYGAVPVVVYEPDETADRHGNFLDSSFRAIRSNSGWNKRLSKIHAQAKSSLPKCERGWKELDSCNSSDALLMNIFCYPGVAASTVVASLLGVEAGRLRSLGSKRACL